MVHYTKGQQTSDSEVPKDWSWVLLNQPRHDHPSSSLPSSLRDEPSYANVFLLPSTRTQHSLTLQCPLITTSVDHRHLKYNTRHWPSLWPLPFKVTDVCIYLIAPIKKKLPQTSVVEIHLWTQNTKVENLMQTWSPDLDYSRSGFWINRFQQVPDHAKFCWNPSATFQATVLTKRHMRQT